MASVEEPSAARAPEAASVLLSATTGSMVDTTDSERPERGRRGTGGRGLSARGRSRGRGFGMGRRAGTSENGDQEDPSYGWIMSNYDGTELRLENKFADEILHQISWLLCRIAVNKMKLECVRYWN